MRTISLGLSTGSRKISSIGGRKIQYLFRDDFSDNQPSGFIDNTFSRPGCGIRQVNDIESLLSIIDGKLRGGGQLSAAWGEERIVWTDNQGNGFDRKDGRTLLVLFDPEEAVSWGDYVIGWASAIDIANPKIDGFGLHAMISEVGGGIGANRIVIPGTDLLLSSGPELYNLRAMQYLLAITINTNSTMIMLSSFGNDDKNARTSFSVPQYPLARLWWIDYSNTTSPLFPSVQFLLGTEQEENYLGHILESARIQDFVEWSLPDSMSSFTDHFTRSNGAIGGNWIVAKGTWTIENNLAVQTATLWDSEMPCVHESGLPAGNGVYQWYVKMPDSATPDFQLIFRYQDINNFMCVRNEGSRTLIKISHQTTGAWTNIVQTGANINWVAGQTFRITVYVEGSRISVFVDNAYRIGTNAGNFFTDRTLFGMATWNNVKAGEAFNDVVAWPFQITLPASIRGKVPQVLTGGVVIGQDSFTDSNDVLLSEHEPTIGPDWVQDNTDWTIQGNLANGVLPSELQNSSQVVQELGVTDCECQVDIVTPADGGVNEYFSGIVKYIDDTHYIGARIVRSDSLQLNSHEIELLWANGAATGVRRKVNLGNFFLPSTTYTLKCQWKGNLMHVFLNGSPVISYFMSSVNGDPVSGTKYGLHKYYLETGCRFGNWLVKAL